jgi:serine/threonine-protein kinase RsbW
VAGFPEMATVELTFTPLPAHVRTARLVATAVARRSGVDEALLDEVRLAVGEACSRAVEAHRMHCPGEPVRIELTDHGGRFEVVVTDAAPGEAVGSAAPPAREHAPVAAGGAAAGTSSAAGGGVPGAAGGGASTAAPAAGAAGVSGNVRSGGTASQGARSPDAANGSLPAGIGLAVIAGLADDVQISATGRGVTVRMSWPARTT